MRNYPEMKFESGISFKASSKVSEDEKKMILMIELTLIKRNF